MTEEEILSDVGELIPVKLNLKKRYDASRVALLECTKEEDLRARTRELLRLLGHLEKVVHPGDRVLIKTNATGMRPREDGAVTDPEMVWGIVESLKELGVPAGAIFIGDAAAYDRSTFEMFRFLGYDRLSTETGAQLIDLDTPAYMRVIVPGGGLAYRSYLFKEALRGFDVLISACKMKTHGRGDVTLGMKNLLGMIPTYPLTGYPRGAILHAAGSDVGRLIGDTPPRDLTIQHYSRTSPAGPGGLPANRDKLRRVIVDMACIFPVALTVVDGVIAMEGEGPWQGRAIESNVLLAGYNVFSTDVIGAYLMGYDASEVGKFKYALRKELGEADLPRIEVVGEKMEKLRKVFVRATPMGAPPGARGVAQERPV